MGRSAFPRKDAPACKSSSIFLHKEKLFRLLIVNPEPLCSFTFDKCNSDNTNGRASRELCPLRQRSWSVV